MLFRGEAFPENTVAFELYPELPAEGRDSGSTGAFLHQIAVECERVCGKDVADYLWHYDAWTLHSQTVGTGSDFVPHLAGMLCYGDNVEDEWFVTWLLFKLTKFVPNLVARVYDSDGEILLIQAADHLPRWLEDHDARNRVFVYRGEVHVIAIPSSPSEVTPLSSSEDPSLPDALRTVRSYPSATRASDAVQQAVLERLQGFPGRMEDQLHRANVLVPAGVASLLSAQPSLLAPAVHAFLERDPIDMRACRAMKFFPPEQCVRTRVTFTRCLYAMLVRSRCDPDPRTGWRLPDPSAPERKEAELGVKLAWGFEILAAATKPSDGEGERESLADVESDERWPKYIESLKTHGYFKGELEGSTEYDRLKAEAVDFFATHIRGGGAGDGADARPGRRVAAGKEIHRLLGSLDVDVEQLRKRGDSLSPSDDDSWLDVGSDDLDEMLRKHFGPSSSSATDDPSSPSTPGQNIPDSLRLFLSQVSSFEGVDARGGRKRSAVAARRTSRHSRKTSAVGGDGADRKISSVSAVSDLSEKITFDSEQFSSALRDILDLQEDEENSFDSDWSDDYGSESEFDDALADFNLTSGALSAGGGGRRKISEEQREIMRIMAAMDEELMAPGTRSVMGESFVRRRDMANCSVYSVDEEDEQGEMKSQTSGGGSGSGASPPESGVGHGSDDDLRHRPVDIDLNAMKNILESFGGQHGLPGPASTLLASVGLMRNGGVGEDGL